VSAATFDAQLGVDRRGAIGTAQPTWTNPAGDHEETRAWFEAALELDAENRALRQQMLSLLAWVDTRIELLWLANVELGRRFGKR
jgi:hypothetical protein